MAVTGDGGFLMNSQELETAARLETPFVVLVFTDCSYGVIRWKQMLQFGRPAFVDFNNPDLVEYAKSFGATGFRIGSADELGLHYALLLDSNKLDVIDCPVDAAENLRLNRRLRRARDVERVDFMTTTKSRASRTTVGIRTKSVVFRPVSETCWCDDFRQTF